MVDIKCLTCGKKFTVIPSRKDSAKFCSNKCKIEDFKGRSLSDETRLKISRALMGKPSGRKGLENITIGKLVKCINCGNKTLQKINREKIFCSDNCRAKLYRKRYPERYAKRYKKWYERLKEENPNFTKERYLKRRSKPNFREQVNRWAKTQYQRLRNLALEKYGSKCECCEESRKEFLGIDHIEGGGTAHRKELKGKMNIYRYLYKNNYPKDFRLLCYNCNSSLGFYGYCPHTKI